MCTTDVSSSKVWLPRFVDYLKQERYCAQIARRWAVRAQRFLTDLEQHERRVEDAQPADVAQYLERELRRYRTRHHHGPAAPNDWRRTHTGGIHLLLRLVQGQWPPPATPSTAQDRFHDTLTSDYAEWMRDRHGLASETRTDRCAEARRFLAWLAPRETDESLGDLGVADLDAYVTSRAPGLRRITLAGVTTRLRSFLRYLHETGRTTRDFSDAITGPRVYACEGIPSDLPAEHITHVLETTRRDRSAIGRRDYAILTLLAIYGLRAGEITRLRLDDIDWHHDILHIHHSKTRASSDLPLLAGIGHALVQYLQHGRPHVTCREVFVRSRAPYRPFQSGSSLYGLVRRRFEAAGVTPSGKKGPHTFRHARAISLLRATVSLKNIGDILGHRSTESTVVYLKLATDDLRVVGLEIPTEVTA